MSEPLRAYYGTPLPSVIFFDRPTKILVAFQTYTTKNQPVKISLSPHFETLRLGDVIMKKVEHATILRNLLDQHLSLNEQISNVAGKLANYVPIMTILLKKLLD